MNEDNVTESARTVIDIAGAHLAAEMMQSWADGMRGGLELAVKMAQVIIDHQTPSPEQKAIVAGLRDTLRDTALTIEPKARDD